MNAADTIAAMRADVEEFKVGLHNLDPSKAAELPAQAEKLDADITTAAQWAGLT